MTERELVCLMAAILQAAPQSGIYTAREAVERAEKILAERIRREAERLPAPIREQS